MNSIDLSYMPLNTKDIFVKLAQSKFISDFTLIGGTALAIQIGHRISEDLDFIYDGDQLNLSKIKRNIQKLFPSHRIVRQDEKYQIDFVINDSKLSFFSSEAILIPFNILGYSLQYENVNIAPVSIIGSLKFSAIAQRSTIRDYYDLYFITKYFIPLNELITQTKSLLPNLSPVTYTETLLYTSDIRENDLSAHLNPKEKLSKKDMEQYFKNELIKTYRKN